jgi:signal transduction histidine kinase
VTDVTASPLPRAYREKRGRWVAGVATGLADHLNWPVGAVRLLFVILSFFGGIGVIAYAVFWAVLPQREADESDTLRLLAFAALVVGSFLFFPASAWMQVGLPLAVVALGATVVWTRLAPSRRIRPDAGQWTAIVLGIVLVVAGMAALAVSGLGLRSVLNAAAVAILLLVGVGLIAMPWIAGLYRELVDERQQRIRSQTRAELATQVHDSVLQTLTLIRRHADQPDQVARLARAEERHLRSWLYEPAGDPRATLNAALAQAAASVEAEYPVTVEVICVGDIDLEQPGAALVAATREALLNAAKHAGGPVSVYAEVADQAVTIYVRDRGPGFDSAAVADDRKGISESMIARMHRVGGTCSIRSADSGTEVTLTLPRRS